LTRMMVLLQLMAMEKKKTMEEWKADESR